MILLFPQKRESTLNVTYLVFPVIDKWALVETDECDSRFYAIYPVYRYPLATGHPDEGLPARVPEFMARVEFSPVKDRHLQDALELFQASLGTWS